MTKTYIEDLKFKLSLKYNTSSRIPFIEGDLEEMYNIRRKGNNKILIQM